MAGVVDKVVAVAVGVTEVLLVLVVAVAVEDGVATAVVVETAFAGALAGVDATDVIVAEPGTIGALVIVDLVVAGAAGTADAADVPTLSIAVFKRSVDTTPTGVATVVAPAGIVSGFDTVVVADAIDGVTATGDEAIGRV